MGWTDQETVALVGGGHTLGRTHGNCPNVNSVYSHLSSSCNGEFTTTAGYEGAWTRTPSKWNYDYFEAMFSPEWVPTKSPEGNDGHGRYGHCPAGVSTNFIWTVHHGKRAACKK